MILEALHWLAADDLQRGTYDACIARAQLLREDAWDSEALELLIEAYLASNNHRAARRNYQRYLKRHQQASPRITQLVREQGLLKVCPSIYSVGPV